MPFLNFLFPAKFPSRMVSSSVIKDHYTLKWIICTNTPNMQKQLLQKTESARSFVYITLQVWNNLRILMICIKTAISTMLHPPKNFRKDFLLRRLLYQISNPVSGIKTPFNIFNTFFSLFSIVIETIKLSVYM